MKSLPEPLLQTLERLTKSGITEGFYLAGGTAIALKYRHRVSIDLDFFTLPGKDINTDLILSHAGEADIVVSRRDTLIFFTKPEQTKVSFFKYDAPLIGDMDTYGGAVALASDIDIACMKAVAIAQRGSKKDFFDLWFLMQKHGWRLSELEKAVATKYPSWNFGVFLRALVYFKDAEREFYDEIEPVWGEIKEFFCSIVKESI